MTRHPPQREFYSIGEVCELLGLKPHVLRYWETQFDAFAPAKNRQGNRVYRARDLELIALIRRLVHEEGYTIEGARRRIDDLRGGGGMREESARALELSVLLSIREELEEIQRVLGPAPG